MVSTVYLIKKIWIEFISKEKWRERSVLNNGRGIMKKIACEVCYQPLGEIATGSKIKKDMKTVCKGCFGLVKMELDRRMNKNSDDDILKKFNDVIGGGLF